MFNYIINWSKVIRENIPLFFHLSFRLNWINALIKPFKIIYSEFVITRAEYLYKVGYKHQKNYLERILNDRFDPSLRRIYLADNTTTNTFYLYKNIESKPPLYMYKNSEGKPPLYMRKNSEYSTSSGFVVFVPSDLVYEEAWLRATVNYYRFAGINYSISTF